MKTKVYLSITLLFFALPKIFSADLGHAVGETGEEGKEGEVAAANPASQEDQQPPPDPEVDPPREEEEHQDDDNEEHEVGPNGHDPEAEAEAEAEAEDGESYNGGDSDSDVYPDNDPEMYPDFDPEMEEDRDEMYPDMMDPEMDPRLYRGMDPLVVRHDALKWYRLFTYFCSRFRSFPDYFDTDREPEDMGESVMLLNEECENRHLRGSRGRGRHGEDDGGMWPSFELMRLIFSNEQLINRLEMLAERFQYRPY
ncbi:uncharacterized protein LOC143275923 [Babylonia areolata]|uniref:uncharacterized protein LOC143275923 n=1 Tax=Babylonia areolata TaxID=304850 RepID=UPI003FCF2F32